MVILGPEEENWAWMKWQNAYQINYLLGSFSCHRCHAERLICTNLKEGEGRIEWMSGHPLHVVWKWIQISRITYVNVISTNRPCISLSMILTLFFLLEWIGALLTGISVMRSPARALLTQLNILFSSPRNTLWRACVCLCVRVLIELWVCHAYLICSCVISYNIRLLQCRDNGRIDLISGERADGHRDLLIASLIPGEYAFHQSVWVFFSGFRFVLNRWTKKATTSKSK